jgi:hypothetical protein
MRANPIVRVEDGEEREGEKIKCEGRREGLEE